jgi:hypothetical protein
VKTGRAVATAYRALLLADDLRERLAALGYPPAPPGDLFAAAWPIAERIVWLERRAEKQARRERKRAGKKTHAVPESVAPVDALAASVTFNAERWRISLAPATDVAARSEVA